jgi:putative membrane protein
MWIDALLGYLHFTAVFAFFAFLSIELYLVRSSLDAARARELARANIWYWGSVAAVAATGVARLFAGAKGAAFHVHAWPLYAKLLLFVAVAGLTLKPAAAYRRWVAAGTAVPDAERIAVRGRLMAAVHAAALIPLLAALMARGLS